MSHSVAKWLGYHILGTWPAASLGRGQLFASVFWGYFIGPTHRVHWCPL